MKLKLPKNFPQPLTRGVIVLPIERGEQKTDTGLIIPDISTGAEDEQRMPKLGLICAMGPEASSYHKVTDIKTGKTRPLQVGDKVSHNPYANTGFLFDTVFYLVMDKEDIKCYFPDEEAIPTSVKIDSRKRSVVEKRKNMFK